MTEDRITLLMIWETVFLVAGGAYAMLVYLDWRGLEALRREGRNGSARLVSWQDTRADIAGLTIAAILMLAGPAIPLEGLPRSAHDAMYMAFTIYTCSALLKIHDRHELYAVMKKESVPK
jgi:hypothetical protein